MKTKTCPDCDGDGVVDKGTDDETQCPTCGGSGFVPDDDDDSEEVLNTSHNRPAEALARGSQVSRYRRSNSVRLGNISRDTLGFVRVRSRQQRLPIIFVLGVYPVAQ